MNTLVSLAENRHDSRPLPLIVAEKWDFRLDYVQEEDKVFWFAIHDWIVGLLEVDSTGASKFWNDIQRRGTLDISATLRKLPHVGKDGKKYIRDYTTDRGLYLIAQHLRVNKDRPLLKEIKQFLAKAGAFVDEVRRRPETVVESGAIDPDKVLDAVIEEYKRRGKDDSWINARITGKVKRAMFTAALKTVILDLSEKHFGMATNEVYVGLWGRNADQLRQEMKLSKYASLRDHQPTLALSYQGIAEEVCAKRLGRREELTWDEARLIVREVADLVGVQAQATSVYLEVDLATGNPLLPSG